MRLLDRICLWAGLLMFVAFVSMVLVYPAHAVGAVIAAGGRPVAL
jgi:hypothetical protein